MPQSIWGTVEVMSIRVARRDVSKCRPRSRVPPPSPLFQSQPDVMYHVRLTNWNMRFKCAWILARTQNNLIAIRHDWCACACVPDSPHTSVPNEWQPKHGTGILVWIITHLILWSLSSGTSDTEMLFCGSRLRMERKSTRRSSNYMKQESCWQWIFRTDALITSSVYFATRKQIGQILFHLKSVQITVLRNTYSFALNFLHVKWPVFNDHEDGCFLGLCAL
jgi:hypothetical protein